MTELYGRNHQESLTWLKSAWWQQTPAVCWIEGFPGVGKTELQRQLSAQLGEQSIPTAYVNLLDEKLSQLSDRHPYEGRWSEQITIKKLDALNAEDGAAYLCALLKTCGREADIPPQRLADVVAWVDGNPRALRAIVASLVLMPSRSEGFGLVALEALESGTPILVSEQSGFAEYVKDKLPKKSEHYAVAELLKKIPQTQDSTSA